MMPTLQTKPYALGAKEGEFLRCMGARITVKATSEQTNGLFNLFDASCPPGFGTPLHIHYAEDVVVLVLEGALTFFWGGEKKEAAAGAYFFEPRGTPHGFRVKGELPTRILYMTIPAGFDRFMTEHKLPNLERDPERDAARYKIEILGPLPE